MMTPKEAAKIVSDYGAIIEKLGNKTYDVFALPYSPGRIRYAYFVYTEWLIKEGRFNKDIMNALSQTYAILDTKFIEDPDEVNDLISKYGKDAEATKKLQERGGLSAFMPSLEKMVEFENYVADLHGNYARSARD